MVKLIMVRLAVPSLPPLGKFLQPVNTWSMPRGSSHGLTAADGTMYLLGYDNWKSGNGKHESVQEPEDNAEAPDAPMVPGLQPPSPRPMVHDPLDRQENEPQQLTAAELARWFIQLCSTKHCMFSLAHLNILRSLVSCLLEVSKLRTQNRPCCAYS